MLSLFVKSAKNILFALDSSNELWYTLMVDYRKVDALASHLYPEG